VTSHGKGGSGVERGGDPCGRPAGGLLSPLSLSFAGDVEEGPLRSPLGDEMCQ
jgi:hypothetical protein